MTPTDQVRVRMAPSPTGPFHIGTARTALFNWLFARHMNGQFILRIEDTDKERSKLEHELELAELMEWLGLDWDEGPDYHAAQDGQIGSRGLFGPYRQSERTALYRRYLEKIIADGKAYYCYCDKEDLEAERQLMEAQSMAPRYSGRCRALTAPPAGKTPQLIRFKMPGGRVEFKDMIRGKVSFDAGLFDDIAIAKDLDTPLYNFANVVDDFEMKITHVIRGEDHISNTPKQVLIYQALDLPVPQFAHLPLILDSERAKLSKRNGKTTFSEYRRDGFLPEALVNFLALLGWHPKGDEEVMSLGEIVGKFEIERVQKSGAIFNLEKLAWLNREHLRRLDGADLAARAEKFFVAAGLEIPSREFLIPVVESVKNRCHTLADFPIMAGFFFRVSDYDADLLVPKNSDSQKTKETLKLIHAALLGSVVASLKREDFSVRLEPVIEAAGGKGQVLWPLRVALSGLKVSPDHLEIAEIIGREEVLRRVEAAVAKLP